jgi:hypothetical protein
MRKAFFQITFFGLLLGGAYVALFERDWAMSLWGKVKRQVKGYKKAETPEQAMEFFNKALAARDFEAAADYVSGDYGAKLRGVAGKAEGLAKAIDDFGTAMEKHNVESLRARQLLAAREPFPKRYEVVKIDKKGDGEAVASVKVYSGLARDFVGVAVLPLKKDGDQWKLALPLTPAERDRFAAIAKHARDYVNAINVVKNRMKTDATTKSDVEKDLAEELRTAEKD